MIGDLGLNGAYQPVSLLERMRRESQAEEGAVIDREKKREVDTAVGEEL